MTEFEGQEVRVSGKLSDTDRIVVKFDGETVISDWINIAHNVGYVEGQYKGRKVKVECQRDPAANMTRQTLCDVYLQEQKIGELFFDVAGIQF